MNTPEKLQLDNELSIINSDLDKLMGRIKASVLAYMETNPKADDRFTPSMERTMDKLVITGAWIHDRTHGVICSPGPSHAYQKSMLRKIRKTLGFSV